jgi:prepilin-type N-terminal cleavage/methylation domain-containing protein
MERSFSRAFTLVEVLVVVGIAGIIVTIGLTPLTYTIKLMSDARTAFIEGNAERDAINRITLDVREVISLNGSGGMRLVHQDKSGEAHDYLMLWTLTPSYTMEPSGTVVVGIPDESVLDNDYDKGLYRWLLSDDKRPNDVTQEDMEKGSRRLILPDVKSVRFSILDGSEWVDEYTGPMPKAFRVLLNYGDDGDEKAYDVWLPRL